MLGQSAQRSARELAPKRRGWNTGLIGFRGFAYIWSLAILDLHGSHARTIAQYPANPGSCSNRTMFISECESPTFTEKEAGTMFGGRKVVTSTAPFEKK